MQIHGKNWYLYVVYLNLETGNLFANILLESVVNRMEPEDKRTIFITLRDVIRIHMQKKAIYISFVFFTLLYCDNKFVWVIWEYQPNLWSTRGKNMFWRVYWLCEPNPRLELYQFQHFFHNLSYLLMISFFIAQFYKCYCFNSIISIIFHLWVKSLMVLIKIHINLIF